MQFYNVFWGEVMKTSPHFFYNSYFFPLIFGVIYDLVLSRQVR